MTTLTSILLLLIVMFVLWNIYLVIKSKRSVGKKIAFEELDAELAEKIRNKSGLIYFYSPSCYNCKKQSPIIENLKQKFDNIISLDISQNLNASKLFIIRGTPSIIVFGGNKIKGYYVGVKEEAFITDKLINNI